MTDDVDTDRPASEQFDLDSGIDVDADEISDLARRLEQVADDDPSSHDGNPEAIADLVAACKRLENAVENARKDTFEEVLDTYASEGERVGPLTKASGSHTYVTDSEGAFAAVADAGADPLDVAKVSVGNLRDVLGAEADDYLGSSEYTYYKR